LSGEPEKPAVRVLIVDDNRDAADSLAYLLQLLKYDVQVAYDGLSGLRLAHERAPDCLISDIRMPGLDGYELAEAVRADPSLAGVKLIALSAYSDDRHARRAAAVGFERVLIKPANAAEVLEVLRMMEHIKELASEAHRLAQRNAALAGETKELIEEVKDEIREVKEEVRELKKEVRDLKDEREHGPG